MLESKKIKIIDRVLTILIALIFILNIFTGGALAYELVSETDERNTNGSAGDDSSIIFEEEASRNTTLENIIIDIDSDQSSTLDLDEATYLGEFKVTAFTAGYESTGKTPDHPLYGITASGATVKEDYTVASDWDVLPPGSSIYVDGVGERVVEDKGGAVKGSHIDLYITEIDKAIEWGVQYKDVWLIDKK